LRIGRAAPGSLFLGSLPALILHLAAVETHARASHFAVLTQDYTLTDQIRVVP
jgi:hypothetical protein